MATRYLKDCGSNGKDIMLRTVQNQHVICVTDLVLFQSIQTMKLITVKLPVLNVKAKGTNVILTQNITKRKELPIDPALFSYCPLCLLEMYRCRYTANHIAVFTQIHIHGKHKPEKDKAPPPANGP